MVFDSGIFFCFTMGKEENMSQQTNYIRYSVITEKNPREIVMLRGSGCRFKRCRFCDYHLDSSKNEEENYELNREVLKKVTGQYGSLEVINSGSFLELDEKTMAEIETTCQKKGIHTLRFEVQFFLLERSLISLQKKGSR